jgi:hypothetical protein
MEIEGVKLIRQTGVVNEPDDPSYPYRLDVNLRPPEFMEFAFVMLHGGSEVICVRGMTREALEQFVELNQLRTHPRLRSLEITQTQVSQR